jgi:hypothetical protein
MLSVCLHLISTKTAGEALSAHLPYGSVGGGPDLGSSLRLGRFPHMEVNPISLSTKKVFCQVLQPCD